MKHDISMLSFECSRCRRTALEIAEDGYPACLSDREMAHTERQEMRRLAEMNKGANAIGRALLAEKFDPDYRGGNDGD